MPPRPSTSRWQTVSALACSSAPPSRLTADHTWVTRPLRSTRITGFPRYYGTPRPCASLRYSAPRGFLRLEFSLSGFTTPSLGFALYRGPRFPRSVQEPEPGSRHLYAV